MGKVLCYRCGKLHAIRNCTPIARKRKHKSNWKREMTQERIIREERFKKMMQIEDGFCADEDDYYYDGYDDACEDPEFG